MEYQEIIRVDLNEIEDYKRKIQEAEEWVSDPVERNRRIKFFRFQIELIERRINRLRSVHKS